MSRIQMESYVEASPQKCFDLSRDVAVHTESSGAERAVGGVTSGLLQLNDKVTFEARHFGIRWRMTSRITEFGAPGRFVDEMQRGPFKKWRHVHTFIPVGQGTKMVDEVDYLPPLWPWSWLVDTLFLRPYMTHLMNRRNAFIRQMAEAPQPE